MLMILTIEKVRKLKQNLCLIERKPDAVKCFFHETFYQLVEN